MAVDEPLGGRAALVTGGSRGIGLAIAATFIDAGAACLITARHEADLEAAAGQLGPSAAWRAANVGDPEAAARCVRATIDRFGRIDVLVNNAATSPYFGPLIDVDLARYDKTIQVNVRGPLVLIQEAWTQWMHEHGGVIINIVSCGAFVPTPNLGVYGMTKAALVHHTRQLALELGPRVRVNAIAPAYVPTSMSAGTRGAEGQASLDRWGDKVPLRRSGTPQDIASAALYLASDASSWVTGRVHVLDGGMLLGTPPGTDADGSPESMA